MDLTQQLLDELVSRLENNDIDDAPKHDANRIFRAISSDIDTVAAEGGYADFVLSYLGEEQRRFAADTEDELPDGMEPRSKPLCGCSQRYCDLKEGKLPIDIRRASSLSAGVREFKSTHHGTPYVLEEAHEEYREVVSLVRQAIGEMIHILSNQQPALAAGVDPEDYGLEVSDLAHVPKEDRLTTIDDADDTEASA